MSATHAAPGWLLASKDSLVSFYFAPDSVETTNDLTEVSVVRNFYQPQSTRAGTFSSIYQTLMVSCQSLRFDITSTLFFQQQFARGERLELEPTDRQRVPPLNQRLPSVLLMRVCGFSA
jgi:hypothetical protein